MKITTRHDTYTAATCIKYQISCRFCNDVNNKLKALWIQKRRTRQFKILNKNLATKNRIINPNHTALRQGNNVTHSAWAIFNNKEK